MSDRLAWAGMLAGLPSAGLCFWLFKVLSPVCEATACACVRDPPCEGGFELIFPWLGFALLVLFAWCLDCLLKGRSSAYARIVKFGNLNVPDPQD